MLIAFPLQQWLYERASLLRYNTLPVLLMLNFLVHVCHWAWNGYFQIWISYSGVNEDLVLVGRQVLSTGKQVAMFRNSVVRPSSGSSYAKRLTESH